MSPRPSAVRAELQRGGRRLHELGVLVLRENERMTVRPDGFAAFVTEQRTSLVRYAMLLTGSVAEAEDIVHEVLTRLMGRWDSLTEPLPYVRRSITNEFLSWRRRWSTRNIDLADDSDLDRATPEQYDGRPDPQMWSQLMALSRPQRSALVLRYYEGFGDDEIADILGCRPATVRSHIHRGVTAIRKSLAEHGDSMGESR